MVKVIKAPLNKLTSELKKEVIEAIKVMIVGENNLPGNPFNVDPNKAEEFNWSLIDYLYYALDEDNDKLKGFLTVKQVNLPHKELPIININDVFVFQEYRRSGIGSALFNSVFKDYNKDHYNYNLKVLSFNKNAIEFYKSLGFKISDHFMGIL